MSPPLVPGEVHVWRVVLDLEGGGSAEAGILSDAEFARAQRFHRQEDRARSIVTRTALRELLARYVGAAPKELRFIAGSNGKPALEQEFATGAPGFNVAHSGRLILLAFATCDVGVDVEEVWAGVEVEELARRLFSADEVGALATAPSYERDRVFFQIWTRKEAFLKAHGAGLSAALDAFSTTTRTGEPLDEVDGEIEGVHWYLRDLEPAAGYAGAVATSQPARVVTLDWPACRR